MTARLLSLQNIVSARGFYADGHWRDDTFHSLAKTAAAARPDWAAITDVSGSITWTEAVDWTGRIAARLYAAGLNPGDRVAIWSASRIESTLIILACSQMGYVAIPSLHRDHTLDDVLALLIRCRAAAIFLEAGYGAALGDRDVAGEIATLATMRHVETMSPLTADTVKGDNRKGQAPATQLPPAADDPDAITFLAFTSGTTGQPKGVMHSSNTYLSNARAVVADYRLDSDTVVYTMSPASHNMGTVSLAITLVTGGTLVLHKSADARRTKERIRETGATYLVGVPTHGLDLLASLTPGETLGAAKVFQLAGATVPLSLVESLAELGITVQNTYGMTENCSFLYTNLDDAPADIGVGRARVAAGMEIAILDPETGAGPLAPGESGEIGIRGCSQMLGYFDDQTATEDSLTADGWFLSGDLGVADTNATIQVVGRKKDLIIRGGHNIHPARVEDLAIRHADIARAAALAVPDGRLGEKMCLAVVLRDGAELEAEMVLTHLADMGLSPYDMPEYFLPTDGFPLTASGKILKRSLARMIADGELMPTPCRYRARSSS